MLQVCAQGTGGSISCESVCGARTRSRSSSGTGRGAPWSTAPGCSRAPASSRSRPPAGVRQSAAAEAAVGERGELGEVERQAPGQLAGGPQAAAHAAAVGREGARRPRQREQGGERTARGEREPGQGERQASVALLPEVAAGDVVAQ